MDTLAEIRVTDIEDGEPVDVVEVLVRQGDRVEAEQPLVALETDKALVEFPSPHAGQVGKISVQPGDKVALGDLLLVLEVQAASLPDGPPVAGADVPKPVVPEQPEQAEDTVEPLARPADSKRTGRDYASPGVYRYARELGVELDGVQGSGRHSRILKQDIRQHVRSRLHKGDAGSQAASGALPDFSGYGETEVRPVTGVQRRTAQNLLDSWRSIPHVTHFDQADVTGLERYRRQLGDVVQAQGVRLTPLAFVIKALAATLARFPLFNASLDPAGEQLVLKKFFHIGIAVDTPHGLLVPVLRDVERKTLVQVARELEELAAKARERKLTAAQMAGASMTVSSLGNLGGQAFTPIINPPEVAVLGLSTMIVQDVYTDGGTALRKLLPLSLSYDHRVINGADAARFCTHLKAVLEDIWKLVLD